MCPDLVEGGKAGITLLALEKGTRGRGLGSTRGSTALALSWSAGLGRKSLCAPKLPSNFARAANRFFQECRCRAIRAVLGTASAQVVEPGDSITGSRKP